MTGLPHHHCSSMCSTAIQGKFQVIHVRRVQREAVFTLEICHYKIKIMSKYLRFREEDQIWHEITEKVLDGEDVPAETFTIPGEGEEGASWYLIHSYICWSFN